MADLNYHHLLYFRTAARERSISRAAERLALSQPTVSAQIRALERAIGRDLFDRRGRELVLTDAGEMVLSYAERIFAAGEELQDRLRGGAGGPRAELRVGVALALPKLVACTLLAPALEATTPIRLVCREDKAEPLLAELALHAFDLVLADAPIGPGARVRAFNHALGECAIGFFAVSELAERLAARFPASLGDVPLLLPTTNTMLRRELDRWFERIGIAPRIAAECEDSAMAKAFGQRGLGAFPAPVLVRAEIERQYDVQLAGTTDEVHERFYAITLERAMRHPAVAAICARARERLAALGA